MQAVGGRWYVGVSSCRTAATVTMASMIGCSIQNRVHPVARVEAYCRFFCDIRRMCAVHPRASGLAMNETDSECLVA